MATLKVKLGGLELDNPIVISSGDVARTEVGIRKADRFRPGAIVLKTSLLEAEYTQIIKPYEPGEFPDYRAKYFWHEGSLFGTAGSLSHWPVETWAEWLKKHKSEIATPLIGSATGFSVESYAEAAKLYEEAGADAFEINYGCPDEHLRRSPYTGPLNQEILREIIYALRKAVSIPLGVKTGSFYWSVRLAKEAGLDYVAINSVILGAIALDIEKVEPVLPAGFGVVGSRAAKYPNFRTLLRVGDLINEMCIVGIGGIQSWEDIVEYILYGASLVGIHSIFVYKGFKIIPDMKQGLLDYMTRHNFNTIDDMKGIIVPKILPRNLAIYAQTKGKIVAEVDQSKCTACGACEDVCAFDAVKLSDGIVVINEGDCEGCGACVTSCPEKALTLRNLHLLRELTVC